MHITLMGNALRLFWRLPEHWTVGLVRLAWRAGHLVRALEATGRKAVAGAERVRLTDELNALCGPLGLGFFA